MAKKFSELKIGDLIYFVYISYTDIFNEYSKLGYNVKGHEIFRIIRKDDEISFSFKNQQGYPCAYGIPKEYAECSMFYGNVLSLTITDEKLSKEVIIKGIEYRIKQYENNLEKYKNELKEYDSKNEDEIKLYKDCIEEVEDTIEQLNILKEELVNPRKTIRYRKKITIDDFIRKFKNSKIVSIDDERFKEIIEMLECAGIQRLANFNITDPYLYITRDGKYYTGKDKVAFKNAPGLLITEKEISDYRIKT